MASVTKRVPVHPAPSHTGTRKEFGNAVDVFQTAQSRQKQVGCFGRCAGDPFTFNGRALM
jgi:hypothetical protein